MRQADAIRSAIPGAEQYFERDVEMGRADFARIRAAAGFEPTDRTFRFYYGTGHDSTVLGVVLFVQVNTMHGPVEVAVAWGAEGEIRSVVVTKATVETKPWILAALDAGLTGRFLGMKAGDDPDRALVGVTANSIGSMPRYFAGVIATAVRRALVLHDVLYERRGGA